jgi:hypothetical protein
MDPDMNKYDLEHACTAHPLMSKEAWERVYADAWTRYYSDAHVETIMRRAVISGISNRKALDALMVFSGAMQIEGVHPLQFGFIRRKVRTQRRPGMPIVNPLLFYPWRAFDFVQNAWLWVRKMRHYRRLMERVRSDPGIKDHIDDALRVTTGEPEADDFVELYADKIPNTHGAPKRRVAAAS